MAHFNQFRKFHCIIIAGVLVLVILISASLAYSYTHCRYSFIFLGKTIGKECTIAFLKTEYGSCEPASNIYFLQLSEDKQPTIDISPYRIKLDLPLWSNEYTQGDSLDWIEQFEFVDGKFILTPFNKCTIEPPAYDSTFPPRPGEFWEYPLTQEAGLLDKYFDDPIIGVSVKLCYRHPGGIYKNYQISDAYRTGEYLFIKTQSLAQGLDHNYPGVLVYKIISQ